MPYVGERPCAVVGGKPLGFEPIIEVLRRTDVEVAPAVAAPRMPCPLVQGARDADVVKVICDAALLVIKGARGLAHGLGWGLGRPLRGWSAFSARI